MHSLSKTDYINYLACPEELWMHKNQSDFNPPFPLDAQHKVEQGQLIDRKAREWFEDGCQGVPLEIKPEQLHFQLTAKEDNCIVIADIVVLLEGNQIDLYEVKAATAVKKEHYHDVAFQKVVFEKAGYQVRNCFLVHVNSSYVVEGELDLCQLFTIEKITDAVADLMTFTKEKLQEAFLFLENPMPTARITVGCADKLKCPFVQYHFDDLPAYSIYDISRISAKKIKLLVEQNIVDIQDVPTDFPLSEKMRTQVDIAQQNKIVIQKDSIQSILDGLEYPLYFLDYETFSYVIPAQAKHKPYQQLLFQYSLHTIHAPGEKPVHTEYLLRHRNEPVEQLVAALQKDIASQNGRIIVWNKGFEMSRNKEIANMYPIYADFMYSMNERIYDLMTIFSKGLYQHPAFKGKSSIKKILPVLCPELSYAELPIGNGLEATIKWHHMTDGRLETKEQTAIYQHLLKYCHLDTWAMVRIWEELKKL